MSKKITCGLIGVASAITIGIQSAQAKQLSDPARQDAVNDSVPILETECSSLSGYDLQRFDWQSYDDELFWTTIGKIQDNVDGFCFPPEVATMQNPVKNQEQ